MHKGLVRCSCDGGIVQHVPLRYGMREEGIQVGISTSRRPQLLQRVRVPAAPMFRSVCP